MFVAIFKNKKIKIIIFLTLLLCGIYQFLGWRSERLQTRDLMLPMKSTISMGDLNDQADFKLYINSSSKSGSQIVNFSIITDVKNNYNQFDEVYRSYEKQDPFFKYRDWSGVELKVKLSNLDGRLIYEIKCYPLRQNVRIYYVGSKSNYPKNQHFKVEGKCNLGEVSGGYYNFNIKVENVSLDFKETVSLITLYAGIPTWNDVFNEFLDFFLNHNL